MDGTDDFGLSRAGGDRHKIYVHMINRNDYEIRENRDPSSEKICYWGLRRDKIRH